jgi:hypothetical protein
MKAVAKQEFGDLAERNGWSSAFAEGYVDGRDVRMRGRQVAKYPLADLDQYREGFLAGYSLMPERRCGASARSGPEGLFARRSR